MRKLPALAFLMVAAFAGGSMSPMLVRAQISGAAVPQLAAGDDMPHRTAKAFGPFIRALVTRRLNTAQQIFTLRRSAQLSLENQDTVRILGRFQKPDRFDLSLVGGRTLGQNTGILFFTIATEDGPVAFKIYYYAFGPVNASGNNIIISRIDVTDDWDVIEQDSINIEILQSPVTVSLSGQIDEGGGG